MASALDHPNICTIYEIGESHSGNFFIAMAYYDGETLRDKIRRGKVPADEALDYIAQIASGLAQAHAKGIVHRDIKPANVIVTNGIAKILDACHAMLPFSGQGVNTAFGDCLALTDSIEACGADLNQEAVDQMCSDYSSRRKSHVDSIANLAIAIVPFLLHLAPNDGGTSTRND